MSARPDLFDGCPSAHALDLIGDRWSLLVVRELLVGPKRFTDLLRGLPKISRNVLSQRLDDLQAAQVLVRRTLPPPSSSAVYELTTRGLELERVLQAIGAWGVRSPLLPPCDTVGADTFVLGLRGHYDASENKGLTARYELRIGMDVFAFEIDRGHLTIRRGGCERPNLVLDVDTSALATVTRGAAPLRTVLTAPRGANVQDFARLFRKPQPVAPPSPSQPVGS